MRKMYRKEKERQSGQASWRQHLQNPEVLRQEFTSHSPCEGQIQATICVCMTHSLRMVFIIF